MHFVILMTLLIATILPCNVVAWSITWPFRSGSSNNAQESLVKAQTLEEGQTKERDSSQSNTRPRKFESPIRIQGKLQQILSTIHGTESACRKELAQNIAKSVNSCADLDVLSDYARIATICHYQSNNRMDQLPSDCSTSLCMKAMNAEAFQFNAIHENYEQRLTMENIGREINAQLWMDAMEVLITELGDMGESALVSLERVRQESQVFMQHHNEEMSEIMENLRSLALKQKLHIDMSEQQFNLTKQEFNYQHKHFDKLREKLVKMETAFAGFDHMVMLLLEIRANQQSYRIFEYLQIFAFYVASLLSARFVLYLADGSFHTSSIRTVYAASSSLSLALELLIPCLQTEYVQYMSWKHRMMGLGATHLVAALSVQSTLTWQWIKSSFQKRSGKSEDTPDEIMDMIGDIIALKTLIPAALLDAKWNPSPTLRNILGKPPPSYQISPPAVRAISLPVAWYKTNFISNSSKETNNLHDENLACDYAHCIVAIN